MTKKATTKKKGAAAAAAIEEKPPLGPGQVRMVLLRGEREQMWLDKGHERNAHLIGDPKGGEEYAIAVDGPSARAIVDRDPDAWKITEGELPAPIDPSQDETLPEEVREKHAEAAAGDDSED